MDSTERKQMKTNRRRSAVVWPFFLLISLLCCLCLVPTVHLSSETALGAGTLPQRDLTESFEAAAHNAKSLALDGLTYIRKVYKIPEQELSAPAPDPACFGSTTDPAVIQAVVDSAAVLLDGQETAWKPDIQLFRYSEYNYYYDETILVITWKEKIDGRCCTFAEVKIADGSQLRRKLAGDSYDSGVREYCSRMARECNAVLATNGDFYAHRQYGVTVYQRQLYRCELDYLDCCFFTASGDMLLVPQGELTSREQTEQYIRDNDVLFSAAFGPILVKDGELQDIYTYRIGDTGLSYSRSVIGMLGELHYLLMTINYDFRVGETATINQAGALIYGKGVEKAYALDGGQTAELWMNGRILNNVDYKAERQVSDILYFASALPSGKGG